MKHIITIILISLSTLCYSQLIEPIRHMQFMGIEIDGKKEAFVSKLMQKEFRLVNENMLKG